MTHTEQAKFQGQTGYVVYDGMVFKVTVIDVRQSWGDTQVLLVPVWGNEDTGYIGSEADAIVQSATVKGASWKCTNSVRFINS